MIPDSVLEVASLTNKIAIMEMSPANKSMMSSYEVNNETIPQRKPIKIAIEVPIKRAWKLTPTKATFLASLTFSSPSNHPIREVKAKASPTDISYPIAKILHTTEIVASEVAST